MFHVTRKTDNALVALHFLAQARARGQKTTSARAVAGHYGMPLAQLMNVLKLLTRAGLVRAERGQGGGYALARRPRDISVLAVMEAVEGPLHLTRCTLAGPKAGRDCPWRSRCPMRRPMQRLFARIRREAAAVTLADAVPPPGPGARRQRSSRRARRGL